MKVNREFAYGDAVEILRDGEWVRATFMGYIAGKTRFPYIVMLADGKMIFVEKCRKPLPPLKTGHPIIVWNECGTERYAEFRYWEGNRAYVRGNRNGGNWSYDNYRLLANYDYTKEPEVIHG